LYQSRKALAAQRRTRRQRTSSGRCVAYLSLNAPKFRAGGGDATVEAHAVDNGRGGNLWSRAGCLRRLIRRCASLADADGDGCHERFSNGGDSRRFQHFGAERDFNPDGDSNGDTAGCAADAGTRATAQCRCDTAPANPAYGAACDVDIGTACAALADAICRPR
jgi:hypothetical protein